VDCNPTKGSEPGKIRPCLIVQTDALNVNKPGSYLSVPLTSNLQPNSLLREGIPKGTCGLQKDSTAIIDQLTAFDASRFIEVLDDGNAIPKNLLDAILGKIVTLFTNL
jgi:mRNA interferase MazF